MARLSRRRWRFAELYEKAPISAIEAARVNAQALARDARRGRDQRRLHALARRPPAEGAHDVIGDRALGGEPMQVAALGRAMLDGLEAGGVLGVVKHMPGHGRARADSHQELPVVDAAQEELDDRPRAVPRAARRADGDDRAPALSGLGRRARRRRVSPTIIGDDDPRRDRLRRPADVRRSRHGGAVGHAARSARGARSPRAATSLCTGSGGLEE